MKLGTWLREALWPASDWQARFETLERECRELSDPSLRARHLWELGALAEDLLDDRQRAVDIYAEAYKSNPDDRGALARIFALCRELGDQEKVARVAELLFRSTRDPAYQAAEGEAWLDAGQPDRALRPLAAAARALPEDGGVGAALAVARREWSMVRPEIERLRAEAGRAGQPAAALYLTQAARIFRMLKTDADEYEALLVQALAADPRHPAAGALLEAHLAEAGRWDELAACGHRRAQAAGSPAEQVDDYRRAGMALARLGQRGRAAAMLTTALRVAYEARLSEVPGHLAMYALLSRVGADGPEVLALATAALEVPLCEDERLGVAVLAAVLAWRRLRDVAAARPHVAAIERLAPDHELVVEFGLVDAVVRAAAADEHDLPPRKE